MTREGRELVEEIRRGYFPRWDRDRRWTFHIGTPPGRPRPRGWCEPGTREIWVKDPSDRHVVIHEIVHAVAGRGHGVKFQRRLRKAADTAEKRGEHSLAASLRKEADLLAETPVEDVYGQLEHAVMEVMLGSHQDAPDYDGLIRYLSLDLGLLPHEFRRYYPRGRRVYDAAVAQAIEYREAQARVAAQGNPKG